MRDREGRLPIVGVMGSGRTSHREIAEPLGRLLAGAGVHLLTGGGRGVMEAVGRGFHSVRPRSGRVIGICPGRVDGKRYQAPEGYPNRWVEIAIRTHLPESGDLGESLASRNHVNVLSSDVVIALPGGAGTASEIKLALRYGKPVLALGRGRGDPAGVRPVDDLEALHGVLEELLEIEGQDVAVDRRRVEPGEERS